MTRRRRTIGRPATGRRAPRPKFLRGVREIIREHLHESGLTIEYHLAPAWNVHPHTVHRIFREKVRSISPEHINAVVKLFKLDEFDSIELHTLGAIESGWNIPFKEI